MPTFKITDYLITPKDVYRGIRFVVGRITLRDCLGAGVVAAAFAVLRFGLHLSGDALFFCPFVVALVYWNLDSRVAFGFALATLILIPFLLILSNKEIVPAGEYLAERVAVWTYYFLVIGTIKQIVEYALEARARKRGKPSKADGGGGGKTVDALRPAKTGK